jgi:hypothetical protein
MAEALGFLGHESLNVPDFDDEQLAAFISQAGFGVSVPDWVPVRPLLLTYLLKHAVDLADAAESPTRASGWISFFHSLCAREAEMFTAVRPETIQSIVSRVALLARSRGSSTGPVDIKLLSMAYEHVNGVLPDEEGIQLLMRLPGLENANDATKDEIRVFADNDLADTAYALDLSSYVLNPYDDKHPLLTIASWVNASSDLGIEVAVEQLRNSQAPLGVVRAAILARTRADKSDAVMADLVRIAAEFSDDGDRINPTPRVAGVYFEHLYLTDAAIFQDVLFDECLFDRVEFGSVDSDIKIPTFHNCIIGYADGLSSVPAFFASNLESTNIEHFALNANTTAGLLQVNVDKESRIALTILRKIFGQRGSARKEGALARGLSLTDRPLVRGVLDEMVSQGWLFRAASGNTVLYVGTKDMRKEASRVLENPGDFKLR